MLNPKIYVCPFIQNLVAALALNFTKARKQLRDKTKSIDNVDGVEG